MIFPTVTLNDKIHAVEDEVTCLCGLRYRELIPKKKKDIFKPIQFKNVENINCRKCKEMLYHNSAD